MNIMDYSLLVGIHSVKKQHEREQERREEEQRNQLLLPPLPTDFVPPTQPNASTSSFNPLQLDQDEDRPADGLSPSTILYGYESEPVEEYEHNEQVYARLVITTSHRNAYANRITHQRVDAVDGSVNWARSTFKTMAASVPRMSRITLCPRSTLWASSISCSRTMSSSEWNTTGRHFAMIPYEHEPLYSPNNNSSSTSS